MFVCLLKSALNIQNFKYCLFQKSIYLKDRAHINQCNLSKHVN
jgi:hypothetical protein